MKTLALILAAAIAAVPAAAGTAPAGSKPPPRFQGLFVDWSNANKQSIEAERRTVPASRIEAGAHVRAAGTVPGSRSLGERVGEIVAAGDCSEGERVARAVGDFSLVAAVREHCNAAPDASR